MYKLKMNRGRHGFNLYVSYDVRVVCFCIATFSLETVNKYSVSMWLFASKGTELIADFSLVSCLALPNGA